MTNRKSLRHYLAVLNPKFWTRCQPTSRAWDKKLNELIDAGMPFTDIQAHTAKIGGHKVWIASYPHSAFTLHNGGSDCGIGVSRSTVVRAREWLELSIINQ